MIYRFLLLVLFFAICPNLPAQVISRFDFEKTNKIKEASIGQDAISVNPSAIVTGGVVEVTAGCGPNSGLNLEVPGEFFNVRSISIDVWFQRASTESIGNFYNKGNFVFGFNGGGRLRAFYEVLDNLGNPIPVILPTTTVVTTNSFDLYSFAYDHCTGVGTISKGGVVVASNDGPDNRPLYYAPNTNVIIGVNLDNNCTGIPGIDWIEIGGNSNDCAPLAVELADFYGKVDENQVSLHWSTFTETNNEGFRIERSVDGTTFQEIAFVAGADDSRELQQYNYIDREAPAGNIAFRLVQRDYSGKETRLETVILEIPPRAFACRIWPNPVRETLFIEPHHVGESVHVRIMDALGRMVHEEWVGQQTGIGNLSPGVYLVLAEYEGKVQHKKIVVE